MAEPRIITLGCRLNAYESEVMRAHARDAGLDECAIIVNTCAVTAEAVRQATQTIRRAAPREPVGAHHRDGLRRADRAGTLRAHERSRSRHRQRREDAGRKRSPGFRRADTERVQVDDIMSVRETAAHLIDGFGTRARAYVQVQNGCDHRCTFCIIPFGRGPSRSVPAGEVVAADPPRSSNSGYREVVLTGVDITSYGADLPGSTTLGKLVRQILKHVPELKRLRLSSIDQVEADEQLLRRHRRRAAPDAASASVAAGRRRHDPEAHEAPPQPRRRRSRSATTVRRLRPDIVFGADLIAGFPTETDDDVRAIRSSSSTTAA